MSIKHGRRTRVNSINTLLAQVDRVSGIDPGGREFESLRVRHICNIVEHVH